MASTEKFTQAAILEYLSLRGIFHYRQNSGAFKTQTGGFYRFGEKGAPDVIAVINGKYIGIEVKDVKGVLNDNQKDFRDRLEKAGGVYLVVRNIDAFMDFISTELIK